MRSHTKNVDTLLEQIGAYADLSRAAHNEQVTIAGSVVQLTPVTNGKAEIGVSGAHLPLPFALVAAGTAVKKTSRALAVWNGSDTKRLDRALDGIVKAAKAAHYVGVDYT